MRTNEDQIGAVDFKAGFYARLLTIRQMCIFGIFQNSSRVSVCSLIYTLPLELIDEVCRQQPRYGECHRPARFGVAPTCWPLSEWPNGIPFQPADDVFPEVYCAVRVMAIARLWNW